MRQSATTEVIIGAFYQVYNELGRGFLESVYATSLVIALDEAKLPVRSQAPLTVYFRGRNVGDFRVDMIVDDRVVVEVKAVRTLGSSHRAQLINYLRASRIEVGLLLNFGDRPEVERMVYDNDRKLLPRG